MKENRTATAQTSTEYPGDRKGRRQGFWRGALPFRFTLFNNPILHRWFLAIGLAIFMAFFLSPSVYKPPKVYSLGEIVDQDIKAPRTINVEDKKSTIARIREAEQKVRAVYDYDDKAKELLKKRLAQAFERMRAFYKDQKGEPPHQKAPEERLNEAKKEFEKILNISLSRNAFESFTKRRFDKRLMEHLVSLTAPFLTRGVVGNKELLLKHREKGIDMIKVAAKTEEHVQAVEAILGLEEARRAMVPLARAQIQGIDQRLLESIIEVAQKLISPNVTFNKKETEKRRQAVREGVKPVFFTIEKGEMIIREGTKVTEEHLVKLQALSRSKEDYQPLFLPPGMTLLFLLIFYVIYVFGSAHIRNFPKENKDLLMLSCVMGGMVLVIKASLFIAGALKDNFPSIPYDSLLFGIPFGAGAMVVSVVLNVRVASIFAVVFSMFAALLLEKRVEFFIYPFLSSLIAAHEVAKCRQRTTLIRAGLTVGLLNCAMVLFLSMLKKDFAWSNTVAATLGFGFLGGVLVGIIVTGVTPLVEAMFGYTTDIKLLELASLDKPIMKDLMMRAPGTYYHSVIVGNLVDAAAESLGANPLLAKVSAYYHDLGKIRKPLYFIENQQGAENPHDRLSPNMSTLILLSHTKDGVDLARKNRLDKAIIDIIRQHHGTSLISYFYQKAKNQSKGRMTEVKEEEFRYPGPKPQTKEAGLVMLADCVEAASKSLSDPTPARIRSLVQQIINDIFIDGQLEECELTLRDLHIIRDSFTRILTSIFHHRVPYPTISKDSAPLRGGHEDLDKKRAEKGQMQHPEDQGFHGKNAKGLRLSKG